MESKSKYATYGFKGHHHSEETKKKFSEVRKGHYSSKKGKTFEEMYGKEKAQALIKKMSLCSHPGHPHSEETKKRLSLSKLREKNPMWMGGTSFKPYSKKFNDEFRLLVKVRDNFCCVNCGISEQNHLLMKGKKIEIHHIDYNKQNTCLENCCALCIKCHNLTNKDREKWIEFFKALLSRRYNYSQNSIQGIQFEVEVPMEKNKW